jgi:hypothetical protein
LEILSENGTAKASIQVRFGMGMMFQGRKKMLDGQKENGLRRMHEWKEMFIFAFENTKTK